LAPGGRGNLGPVAGPDDSSTTRARDAPLQRASWAALAAVVSGAIALRFFGLDHLPGINGDEAELGTYALSWLHGQPLATLRTGTDLPMNGPYFGVLALVHELVTPSFFALRLAPLIHSVATIALAFLLFRKQSKQLAAVFAGLVAVLPIHLGYSRLAWDPAAVPTMIMLGLAAATRLRLGLTLVAFGLCLWVHPTTAFCLPILASPFVAARWPRDEGGRLRRPSVRAWILVAFALAAAIASFVLLVHAEALPTPVLRAVRSGLPSRILQRLASPGQAASFALLYAELVSGPAIYRYMAGSIADGVAWLHVGGLLAVVLAVVVPAVPRLRRAGRSTELAVVCGLLVSLALTFVIGGLVMLKPHTARYGMFLTAPTCYVLAVCVDAHSSNARRASVLRLATALLGALLLTSFATNLLGAQRRGDPLREDGFRTGDVDPKQQALQVITKMRTAGRTAVVLAEDWWIYWPIRYLADREPRVRVTISGQPWDFRFPRDFTPPPFDPATMELFGVAWAGSRFDARASRSFAQRVEVGGYEPGPILRVYRLRGPSGR
jgi:hypothetical protein